VRPASGPFDRVTRLSLKIAELLEELDLLPDNVQDPRLDVSGEIVGPRPVNL